MSNKLLHSFLFRTLSLVLIGSIIFSSVNLFVADQLQTRRYSLSPSTESLVGKSTVELANIEDTTTAITYNRASEDSPKDIQKVMQLAAAKEDATGKKPYSASLAKDPKEGITFGDSTGDRSFSLTPTFDLAAPRKDDEGRVVYPNSGNEKHIYTFKTNGIKSDIVLNQAPKENETSYSWQMNLGSKLEARMLPDGSVGIYSADTSLFDNVQVGDDKSQQLIDKARANGEKNTLVFELPKPFIANSTDQNSTKNYDDVNYTLDKSTDTPVLTLQVRNLKNQQYPLSIDPTITVTTTSDFQQKTGDTGNTDYSTTDEIRRGSIGSGAVGAVTVQGAAFTNAREDHTTVAYNGYMYIIGGYNGTISDNDIQRCPINATTGALSSCTRQTNIFTSGRAASTAVVNNGYIYIIGGTSSGTNFYNDIQYCAIASDASITSCTQQTNAFTTGRYDHTSVVYNGYLYIVGGANNLLTPQNDIQRCQINADGSVVTPCTQQTAAFTTARYAHASVVYSGYLYIVGGYSAGGVRNNDIQYCPINSDGSVGTCVQQTSAFTTGRDNHTSVVYNGYLYVLGGQSSTVKLNDIQYCPINSKGSVGTCSVTSTFTTIRHKHTSVAYNGYLYVVGGYTTTYQNDVQRLPIGQGRSSTWTPTNPFATARDQHTSVAYNGYLYVLGGLSTGSTYQNDVQYVAINSDGTVGTWASAGPNFTTARYNHTSVAYNGYMYVIGGIGTGGISQNDVQYASISANGTVGTWTATTAFTTARYGHTSVAYKGYLYVIGGNGGGNLNDVQYVPINTIGTIGTWATTTAFTTARYWHTSVAHNGYLYVIGGFNGTNQNDVQYAPINSAGAVGTWTTTTAFTTARRQFTSVTYGGYLYILGGTGTGAGCTVSYCNDVQYAPINSDGTVGTWATTTAFTTARYGHSSAIYNGYLYVIGGTNSVSLDNGVQYANIGPPDGRTSGAWTTNGTSFMVTRYNHTSVAYNGYLYFIGGTGTGAGCGAGNCNDVQYAPINSNGSVGAWHYTHDSTDDNTTFVAGFTTPRYDHASVAYKGYLYVIGGYTGAYLNDVQYAPLNANGTIGTWASAGPNFTTARQAVTSVVYNGYLYVMGGYNGSYHNTVQYAPLNANGTIGTWASATSFTTQRFEHSSVAYNGYMYIIGGYNGAALNGVQYAVINADGSLGAWTATSVIAAVGRQYHTSVAYNGYLYVIGGNNGTFQNSVQYAPLNADGTVGNWHTTTSFTTARGYHTSVAYEGYLYVIGGFDSVTSYNDVQYASVTTVADEARYERTFDTSSSGNIINSFVIDGIANCSYTVTYKTAGASNIFGSTTILPSVYPGVVQTITSASTRYVNIVATLDDATCGGQSTITSISLTYNLVPDAPVLTAPVSGLIAAQILPEFRMGSTDDSNDYLRYKIEVCSISDCSSIVRTIDQTTSQTGWTGQSVQSGTAYTGGSPLTQLGIHQYQTPALTASTQYWWRAYAIDPGGNNQWSAASAISTFTTGIATPDNISIGGGTEIFGGTNFSTGN